MPKKGQSPRARAGRELKLRVVRRTGDAQGGVVSRDQLRALGVSDHELAANLAARRWRTVHSQSVAVHTGPLDRLGHHWAAVFEAGDRGCLDGASALIAGGLEHYTEDVVRESVPRGVLVRRATGVDIRQTRRWDAGDLAPSGIPRTRPDVAGVRAALWAQSDKQAALLLTMTVQQGLTSAERFGAQLMRVRKHRRRILVATVVTDLLGGGEVSRRARVRADVPPAWPS